MAAASTRRLRAFKRWMRSQGIEVSDALELVDGAGGGISVKALCDLRDGDVVARIPKRACLTVRNSAAGEMIEAAGLGGCLGLAVAIMYEQSLGSDSPWAAYLQLLPQRECLPLVWTLDQVDSHLAGTEIYTIVKEDKALVYEDWKECILPFVQSAPVKLDPKYFGVEQYFAAKTLIASRSFEIDNYHGFGMVPVADLFNHKTEAEDVHFTAVSSHSESDNNGLGGDEESSAPTSNLSTAIDQESSFSVNIAEQPSIVAEDLTHLEMIIVKDVIAGAEVFNTYGSLGNAALLHRYGFTEPDNPFDIVNLDLELILRWASSMFSSRYCRARLSLWRRLNFSGCVSGNSEYFEISSSGEPQIELLVLLYVLLLPEGAYDKLDLALSTFGSSNESTSAVLLKKSCPELVETTEISRDLLLTTKVCNTLLALADLRGSFYGPSTIEEDVESLSKSCRINDRALYHSRMLRISERRILEKLKSYAATGATSVRSAHWSRKRRKSRA